MVERDGRRMNWTAIFYLAITVVYGEVMYIRGRRDISALVKQINERARIVFAEKEEDESDN